MISLNHYPSNELKNVKIGIYLRSIELLGPEESVKFTYPRDVLLFFIFFPGRNAFVMLISYNIFHDKLLFRVIKLYCVYSA